MPIQDRTTEFRACVDSIRNRSSHVGRGGSVKQPLLGGKGRQREGSSRSEFSRMAAGIGKDISKTTTNLQKLAQLAKRKTLFDDRPMEISELTHWIKQDIAKINKDIAALQGYVRAQQQGHQNGNKQVDEHESNIVVMLQNQLASTSIGFKEVLEVRTQNMKETKDRTEQFMYSTAQAAQQAPSSTHSLLFNQSRDNKGKGRAVQDEDVLALDIVGAEEGRGGNDSYMQMQLVEQQDNYIQSRSTAIESIESTIAELGSIFSQLATMVAEQRETVQRIDADTMDIAENVSGAQRELLKYWQRVSSNRTLMLQVFGVLILFVRDFIILFYSILLRRYPLQFLVFILVS
ncbi:hypothetical protein M422DRAFT_195231 [Sphaerobolus stellatus SS14]|uniref:t-SNARE coiled-coil homology domain-containing protein n=1 Tax=Sphaerobolus stellatus (strain SS14) TaxID=990650 RepID=A0A0C9T584_SPHS4|nr:hypothetical protein M422DRAFT_195231 [Sphaerobolus stellatus SS14]